MIAEEVDDEKAKETAVENRSSSRKQVERSTGLVDCPQYQKFGRPVRSTDVHNVHKLELGRPTESIQLSVGHPVDRPVDRWKRSVDRPVDRQAGAGCECRFRNLFVFKGCGYFSRVLYLRKRES